MYKKLIITILALFAIPLASAKTLLIVGDSISAGFGIEEGKGWVSLLDKKLQEQKLDYKIINASISGDTTSNGVARMPALIKEYKPDVVVIEMGGNDGLRGTQPKLIKQNLTKMVEYSKEAGAKTLLIGIQLPPNYGPAYLERFINVFDEVANEQNVALLPSIVASTGGNEKYMQADGIHPNAEGQAILLADVWAKLEPLLHK